MCLVEFYDNILLCQVVGLIFVDFSLTIGEGILSLVSM